MADLRPDGGDVRIGDVVVRAPGLRGDVVAGTPASGAVRASEATTPLDAALGGPDLVVQQHVVITATEVETARLTSTVRGEVAHPGVVEVEVPAPVEGWGQFLAVYDANTGTTSWEFAVDEDRPVVTSRGSTGRRRYAIAVTRNDAAPAATAVRGPIGKALHKVVKVVAFKLFRPAAGAAAQWFAERYERANNPHELWVVPDDDIRDVPPQPAPDWSALTGGPVLLLVHGTFSSARNGFGSLDQKTVQILRDRYEGRVLAFDHPTISVNPLDNARWFFGQVGDGLGPFDVMCHSRGGLVSRVLAGGHPDVRESLDVRRIVFVAAPNSGTPLASAPRMEAFIDTYTNLINLFPDHPVLNGIQAVIEVVKDVAAGALAGLPGLQAMRPGGPFLTALNDAGAGTPGVEMFAIAADYEPADPGVKAWAVDAVADAAFAQVANDLVVPTEGAYTAGACPGFPVDATLISPEDATHHCRYFGTDVVRGRLLDLLVG
ncbi:MAG TPA: alpha/beta hydrolase [Frankiaceae bacterium]|nr:alpha/beta hydrolase [Frankiaceae bacterium]